jgi:hypothetical protein
MSGLFGVSAGEYNSNATRLKIEIINLRLISIIIIVAKKAEDINIKDEIIKHK